MSTEEQSNNDCDYDESDDNATDGQSEGRPAELTSMLTVPELDVIGNHCKRDIWRHTLKFRGNTIL